MAPASCASWHSMCPTPPAAAVDDDGVVLAEPELPDDVDRGAPGEVEPAGDLPSDVLRLLDDGGARHPHPFRVRPALGVVPHDLVADTEVLHALASGAHDAGEVDALVRGEGELDVVLQLPFAEEALDVVQAGGHHLDDDLTGSGLRSLLLDDLDHVEPAVAVVLHCVAVSHGALLRRRSASRLLVRAERCPHVRGTSRTPGASQPAAAMIARTVSASWWNASGSASGRGTRTGVDHTEPSAATSTTR